MRALYWFGSRLYYFIVRSRALHQRALMSSCGDNVYVGSNCFLSVQNLEIGSNVHIGHGCMFISAISKISIGDYVMFGNNVTIRGGNHRIDDVSKPMYLVREKLPENDRNVKVCEDVWIGSNVTILTGVTIETGCVIAAGAVVTKSTEPYGIYAGVPAKKIKSRK